jgi:hypothetical protein
MNVADEATRDSSSCDFSPEGRLVSRPSCLPEEEENWPSEPTPSTTTNEDDDLELRPTLSISLSNYALPLPDLCRFSKWLRLIRSTAWMMRFTLHLHLHYIQKTALQFRYNSITVRTVGK